jgi:hypothetical protein
MAWDLHRQRAVLFGGSLDDGTTWEWDGWRWSRVAVGVPGPPPRYDGAMAYDTQRRRTVLFGGRDGVVFFTDTWEWDGAVWTRMTPLTSPPGAYPAVAYDEARQRTVLFHGQTWEWDGVTWTRRQIPQPTATGMLAYDAARRETVLWTQQETWTYDGLQWTRRQPAVSPPPMSGSIACDRDRQRIVLLGNRVGTQFMQTWFWDGATWTRSASPSAPPPRPAFSLVYDPAHRQVVMFGTGNDTWLLHDHALPDTLDYGTGCGGPAGAPLLAGDEPYLGNAGFAMEVRGAPAAAPCLVGVGAAIQAQPLGSGCTLLVQSPLGSAFAVANGAGVARLRPGVPASPALRGLMWFWQAAALDPAAPLGVSLTQGRRIQVGD